ncbi:MAG: CobW family GTP-binding protein [Planctomycetes bacterium]|nr:CobW family GTP-binding protein [Planctomycetota bacterium]
MAIRAHLITGFLGAGKTTTLLHLLKALKARGEQAAVLVNEFGPLGIDGTIVQKGEAISVKELPEGCICCTMAPRLMEALAEIAAKVKPARLFVEPTGLARPDELRRIFGEENIAAQYELGPVLTVVDPMTYLKVMERRMPFYEHQIRGADVIIANKLDRTKEPDLARFRSELPKVNANAKVVETTYGQIDLAVLEGGAGAPGAAAHGEHLHAHGEHLDFALPPGMKFDGAKVRAFFDALDAGSFGVRPWRAKGIFNCADGWRLFQFSDSGVDESPDASSPGDNRCEVIAEKLEPPVKEKMSAALRACVV